MPNPDPTYEGQARVYRRQGATAFVIASGGTLEIQPGGSLNLSSGAITFPGSLAKGYRELPIFDARQLASAENFFGSASDGGQLSAQSTPTLTMNSTVIQQAILTWASGNQSAIAFPPISVPRDFDSSQSITINAIVERASDNASNNVFDYRFWNGANATEMGTTGSTLTTTPTQQIITIGTTALSAYPGVWNIQIVPGTHTNNAVRLTNAWVEYGKRTS